MAYNLKDKIRQGYQKLRDATTIDEKFMAGINRVKSQPLSTYNIANPNTFAKAWNRSAPYNILNPTTLAKTARSGSNALDFVGSRQLPRQNNPILQGLGSAGQEIVRNTGQGLRAMSTGIEQRKPLTFAAGAFRTAAPVVGAYASPAYSLGGMALGGTIGALTNKDKASGFGSGAVQGLKTAAVTRFTDPVISKGLSNLAPGSSLLKRQVAQRVGGGLANVAEDEIIARIDQLKTSTPEKALSFIIGAGISGNDQLIDAAKNALRKRDKKQIKRVANTLADELQRKYKGKTPPGYRSTRGSNQYVNIVEPSKPKFSSDLNRQLGLDPYPKNALQDLNAVGAVAGFEQDEEGKWRYDPAKGAAGLAVATLGTKATRGASEADYYDSVLKQARSQVNNETRSAFTRAGIDAINRVKSMANSKKFIEGGIETLRVRNSEAVEEAIEVVREATRITDDNEALAYALSLPTAKNSNVPTPKAREFMRAYVATPTDNTLNRIKARDARAMDKEANLTYREWANQLKKQEKLNKDKLSTQLNRLGGSIEENTAKNIERLYATSQEGKVLTTKGGTPLSKDIINRSYKWKDKPKLSYSRETMDRNFEDIMGKDAPEMKRRYLDPIKKSETDRIKFLNKERQEIKNLGIKPGSKESELLQRYGEKQISPSQLRGMTKNADKIINAERVLRQKYDTYLTEINKVLIRNGYDPIPKRKDYFLHFQEISSVLERYGIPVRENNLPTDINGLSADFRPGKNFFSSALPRLGEKTDFDAIKGIDRYIEGASKQIYHTDNIQNLRLLDKAIREAHAGTQHLSNFAAELTEYTNTLAGKKAMIDRAAESLVGRKIYGAMTRLKSQVGANAVGANLSSALTNFIPFTQSLATTDKRAFAKGLVDTVASTIKDDGFVAKSDFLTRRLGSDRLAVSKWDKIADKGGWIFKVFDQFTSQAIVRSKYLEGIQKNLSPEEAMKRADDWAARVLADRSLGSIPTVFNSKTLGLLTQFQLEVNNQVSFMLKDIPRAYDKKAAASALGQLFVYSFLFNEAFEKATGRRPAFDPIGIALQAHEDFTDKDTSKMQASNNLLKNVTDVIPFASVATGGRIPTAQAMPNPFAVMSGDSTVKRELSDFAFGVLPPTGGGQLRKTLTGLGAYGKGASETEAGRVRYPVPQTGSNLVKTALFGQYSTPEAREYFDKGRTPLGDKQSEAFRSSSDPEGYYNRTMLVRDLKRGGESEVDRVIGTAQQGSLKKKFADMFGVRAAEKATPDTISNFFAKKEAETQFMNDLKEIYKSDLDKQTRDKLIREAGGDPVVVEAALVKSLGSHDERVEYFRWKLAQQNTREEINGLFGALVQDGTMTKNLAQKMADEGIVPQSFVDYITTQRRSLGLEKGKKISIPSLVSDSELLTAFKNMYKAQLGESKPSTSSQTLAEYFAQRRKAVNNMVK